MNILTSADRAFLSTSLDKNTNSYNKTMDCVVSGSELNKSSEDVVAFAKSSSYGKKISQYSVIQDNIRIGNEALSMVAKAQELALENVNKIKDLTLQVSNGTYSDLDKDSILKEIRSRLEYIDYVAASTVFNDKKLLDGSVNSYLILFDTKQTLDVSECMQDVHAATLGIDLNPGITGSNWTQNDIDAYLDKLDIASNALMQMQIKTGAFSMNLDNALGLAEDAAVNYIEGKSEIVDTDYSKITSELTKYQIMQQLSLNMVVQYNQLAETTFNSLFSGVS